MVCIKSLVALGLFSAAMAAPAGTPTAHEQLSKRQSSGAWTCGSTQYTALQIAAAQQAGCADQRSGKTVGKDKYPHQYKDYEGFAIPVAAPWYEFPILAGGRLFDGASSPGADRVIFNGACQFGYMITHTGASGNDFVACTQAAAPPPPPPAPTQPAPSPMAKRRVSVDEFNQ